MRTGWLVVLGVFTGCAADASGGSDTPYGAETVQTQCAALSGTWNVSALPTGGRQSCPEQLRPASLSFASTQAWMGFACTMSTDSVKHQSSTCAYQYRLECPAPNTGNVYRWTIDVETPLSGAGQVSGLVSAEDEARDGHLQCEASWSVTLTR
jgi:hypothetical protein